MTSSWKFLLYFKFIFLLSCAPVEVLSPIPVYSSSLIHQSSIFYNQKDQEQILELGNSNLRGVFNDISCSRFGFSMLQYIYNIIFSQSPPPPAFLVRKRLKSYAKNQLSNKADQKTIRSTANSLADIYQLILDFFSDKTQSTILQEWSIIEKSFDSRPPSETPNETPNNISLFLDQVHPLLNQIELSAAPIELSCLSHNIGFNRSVTFLVGMNIFEMAESLESRNIMSKEEFLRESTNKRFIRRLLGEDIDSLEGYLYPGSYSLSMGEGASDLLRKMADRFLKVYSSIQTHTPLSRHQAVTLASIIEKEALLDQEKPIVASVFYNRLRRGMRLQSDPTSSYGVLKQTGQKSRSIRQDILTPTKYNTYRIYGLPYGPIANPGLHALKAVFQPSQTPYYFFVKKGRTWSHTFSKTYEEHKIAAAAYRRSKNRTALMNADFIFHPEDQAAAE